MTASIGRSVPLVHRSALDALEAQRAAYQRYARFVEQQQLMLGDGDPDRVVEFVSEAATQNGMLQDGARGLVPLIARARVEGGPDVGAELDRRVGALMRDAQAAEMAIRNLAGQLEAWRDSYGRQLAELGVFPGAVDTDADAEPGSAAPVGDVRAPNGGYGPRGAGTQRTTGAVPSLIDRRG